VKALIIDLVQQAAADDGKGATDVTREADACGYTERCGGWMAGCE
jgi:hypothetical protein